MIATLSWLLRASLWAFVVAQAAVLVTAVRARRWIDLPEITWTGLGYADAAQIVTDHLCHVRDGVFAFPAGSFAPDPDRHRTSDGAVCVVEDLPSLIDPLRGNGDDAAEALLGLTLWLTTLPRIALGVGGFCVGIWFTSSRVGDLLGIGVAGDIAGGLLGAVGGGLLGAAAGYLLAALMMMLLALLAAALMLVAYVLAGGHRRLLRSRIEATVTQDDPAHVRIAIRVRGLGAYFTYVYVFKGLCTPRREPPSAGDETETVGVRRATVLLLQALGAAAVLVIVGLFTIV